MSVPNGGGTSGTTVAICGSITVAVLFVFLVWFWLVRTGRQMCACVPWPWQRRAARAQTPAPPPDADDKLARAGSTHDEPPRMLSVVVVHPGHQLDLGTTEVAAGPDDPAPACAEPPIGVIVRTERVAPRPPPPAVDAQASARAAAYMAELEDREAARREMHRRPDPSTGWAMSFLPFIV